MNAEIAVRPARFEELEAVNRLRRMVNDLHCQGRPDIFRPGFGEALQNHLFEHYGRDSRGVLVAVSEDEVAGFAMVEVIDRPESPYNLARSFYHVVEFGVDERFRRRGVATALVDYMRRDARERGLARVELDAWAFNEGALAFYARAGFKTFRYFMELDA